MNNLNNIRIGRKYQFKGEEYKVISINSHEVYVTKDGKSCRKFGLKNFIKSFAPLKLELGDAVELISMGKTKGYLIVSKIDENVEYGVTFDKRSVRAKSNIDANTLKIEVDSPEQSTEYFYANKIDEDDNDDIEEIKKILDNWQSVLDKGCYSFESTYIFNKLKQIKHIMGI